MREFTEFVKRHHSSRTDLVGLEVGVYRGQNADEIYLQIQPALLVLIDCWEPKGLGFFEGDDAGESQSGFIDTYLLHKDRSNVVIIKGWSKDLAGLFRDEMFDFVYTDGNHCLLQCQEDLQAWYPKVKPGGVFGGHDFNMEGVSRAVEHVFPEGVTVGSGASGTDWWRVK